MIEPVPVARTHRNLALNVDRLDRGESWKRAAGTDEGYNMWQWATLHPNLFFWCFVCLCVCTAITICEVADKRE